MDIKASIQSFFSHLELPKINARILMVAGIIITMRGVVTGVITYMNHGFSQAFFFQVVNPICTDDFSYYACDAFGI